MLYVGQIHPIKYGIERNKLFLRLLYETRDLIEVSKWFDKREDNVYREKDTGMNLEKFLNLMNDDALISLQFASPTPDRIVYCVRQPCGFTSRFAWMLCTYNESNFNVFSRLFEKSFGTSLSEVPKGQLHQD